MAEQTQTYDWARLIRLYELMTWCGYATARADVERRRAENGDDEAARWFERVASGERLTWNTKA